MANNHQGHHLYVAKQRQMTVDDCKCLEYSLTGLHVNRVISNDSINIISLFLFPTSLPFHCWHHIYFKPSIKTKIEIIYEIVSVDIITFCGSFTLSSHIPTHVYTLLNPLVQVLGKEGCIMLLSSVTFDLAKSFLCARGATIYSIYAGCQSKDQPKSV